MESLRKWFCRPKKDDKSLLAQFFFADEALNMIASELDSFDGRKDPERCTALVNQLRQSQDRVLTITNAIMDVLIAGERANRDFRVKFPEDVLQENLAGQLWFGAECLAAGSSIMNREAESAEMRPLAKALTKTLENVRNLLREACLRCNTPNGPLKLNNDELITEMLVESLKIFDRLFAEFELCYVSAMVPVKTTHEYELQELIGVLFSETLQRALKMGLLTQEMVDDYDPALMFTIPRLAIVSGLLMHLHGPLAIDEPIEKMSEMFRPFRTLLHKIRELLWTLNKNELYILEKLLCDNEQITDPRTVDMSQPGRSRLDGPLDDFVDRFYSDYPTCKDFISNFYTVTISNGDAPNMDYANEASELTPSAGTPIVHTSADGVKTPTGSVDIPSTSGYLVANTVTHDTIVASMSENTAPDVRSDSPPDSDCLEVVSAKLSSILLTENTNVPHDTTNSDVNCINSECVTEKRGKEKCIFPNRVDNLDSPDDSGICTENTSLDRSPSLDYSDIKNCDCANKSDNEHLVDNNKSSISRKISHHNIKCTYNKRTGRGLHNEIVAGTTTERRITNREQQKPITPTINHIIKDKSEDIDDEVASVDSSDTSSFNSNCADDEEIALAIQAAEIANRNELRARFRSSEDMIHRLFVCIAGVADQLQTNFASDLRNILKAVFLINATNNSETNTENSIEYHPSESEVIESNEFSVDPNILAQEALFDSNVYFQDGGGAGDGQAPGYNGRPGAGNNDAGEMTTGGFQEAVCDFISNNTSSTNGVRENELDRPPTWIPDVEAPRCMSCAANFTVVKRRHHCRNCGKVFCARCSSNSVPLPKYGHIKPVRVCNKCFMYHLTPFTM